MMEFSSILVLFQCKIFLKKKKKKKKEKDISNNNRRNQHETEFLVFPFCQTIFVQKKPLASSCNRVKSRDISRLSGDWSLGTRLDHPLIRTDSCKHTRGEGNNSDQTHPIAFSSVDNTSSFFLSFLFFCLFSSLIWNCFWAKAWKRKYGNAGIANRVSERRLLMSRRGMICFFLFFFFFRQFLFDRLLVSLFPSFYHAPEKQQQQQQQQQRQQQQLRFRCWLPAAKLSPRENWPPRTEGPETIATRAELSAIFSSRGRAQGFPVVFHHTLQPWLKSRRFAEK